MNKYTSLKLSKLLQENGFKGKSEIAYYFTSYDNYENANISNNKEYWKTQPNYKIYNILNDLCVKYAKEMFGDYIIETDYIEYVYNGVDQKKREKSYYFHSKEILVLLQQNEQKEAEEYLWTHCLYNPENK